MWQKSDLSYFYIWIMPMYLCIYIIICNLESRDRIPFHFMHPCQSSSYVNSIFGMYAQFAILVSRLHTRWASIWSHMGICC